MLFSSPRKRICAALILFRIPVNCLLLIVLVISISETKVGVCHEKKLLASFKRQDHLCV